MHASVQHRDTGLGISTAVSVVLHAVLFAVILWWQQLLPVAEPAQTTYYVDVINLPVADPRTGSPTQTASEAPLAQQKPTPAAPASPVKSVAPLQKPDSADDTAAFQQRLAKLEGKLDEQRQAATLDALKKRVNLRGKVGIPQGTGAESGSDYTAYLHSRLKDAFRDTISYQSKDPFVMVRITIDGQGKILRTRLERSSGDRAFERSVIKAIALAEQTIVPPPDHKLFEGAFVFKPQGVSQK